MPAPCCKEKWPLIPDDEPVFILRGQDMLVIPVIEEWMRRASKEHVNSDKLAKVNDHLNAIRLFQVEHPERCKLPD